MPLYSNTRKFGEEPFQRQSYYIFKIWSAAALGETRTRDLSVVDIVH